MSDLQLDTRVMAFNRTQNPQHLSVMWVCPVDGGYKTGELVVLDKCLVTREWKMYDYKTMVLVKHSCTGTLEFVHRYYLEPRPPRD